ncbi:MAG TPA: ABC transporter substrate-binding protein [Candidatus Choladousia intestinavium]|uniref:ABC transporter substrate-binding protein n=1 Tax=Candidatus Choladousia intestinavium TaxID=2840727 RepID=A0A9D1ABW3_9FIRM|nr:ABC transporter substrate-binding protein [Candidatus Choladousia intestinavium]
MKRHFKKALALTAAAALMAGSLMTAPVSAAEDDRTLNLGIGSEISNLVPMSNNVAVSNRDGLIVFALYDPLLWYNTETNELEPWLATEWSHNEEGTEWYFTLRDDVYFHNGEKMTAEDVAWSINLIPENPVVTDQNIPGFDRAEVVDDTHVTVYMEEPFASTDNFFASYHMVMLDKSYQEEVGWEGYIEHPIGTGPYKFVDRAIGSYVSMEANEDYWQGAPDIKKVNLQIIPDANSQLLSLETGEVDALQNVSLQNCEMVEGMDGFEVSYCTANTVAYIQWGSQSQLNTDENLRLAICAAIDPEAINTVLNKGHTTAVSCMIAPGLRCRPEDGTFTTVPAYDPEAASEYLESSNYNGDPIVIIVPSGSKEEAVCQVIQGNLQNIGMTVELKAVDGATHQTLLNEGNFDISVYSGLPSLYDCNLLYQLFMPGTQNYENSKSEYKEELAELGKASAVEMDEEARTEIFRQMIEIMNTHVLTIPLYQDCNTFCYSTDLANVKAIPGTNVRIAEWSWAE